MVYKNKSGWLVSAIAVSAIMMSGYLFMILLAIPVALCDDHEVEYIFYSKLGTESFLPGKSCAEIYQINKASRQKSGFYWVRTISLYQVYCDMELECGGIKGGWTRVAYLDASIGGGCPSSWSTIALPGTSEYVCRSGSTAGCYSTYYSTLGISFSKICGQAVAYQKGSPDAFHATSRGTKSINDVYMDGLSITVGNPRKHVWTYAAGVSDDHNYPTYNCPCAHVPGPHPPAFVGEHYYCESGDTGNYDLAAYYNSDVLWDGHNCVGSQNNCCANPDMPWFFRQFARNIHGEKLEARICHHEEFANEDTLVQKLELYVQ